MRRPTALPAVLFGGAVLSTFLASAQTDGTWTLVGLPSDRDGHSAVGLFNIAGFGKIVKTKLAFPGRDQRSNSAFERTDRRQLLGWQLKWDVQLNRMSIFGCFNAQVAGMLFQFDGCRTVGDHLQRLQRLGEGQWPKSRLPDDLERDTGAVIAGDSST